MTPVDCCTKEICLSPDVVHDLTPITFNHGIVLFAMANASNPSVLHNERVYDSLHSLSIR